MKLMWMMTLVQNVYLHRRAILVMLISLLRKEQFLQNPMNIN